MKVLFVASECTPFAKVGGLGDVLQGLPQAVASLGHEVSVVLPLYQHLLGSEVSLVAVEGSPRFTVHFEGRDHVCELYRTTFHSSPVSLYLVKNVTYLSNGGIYLSDDAMAVGNDEPRRFMFFCRAVFELLQKGVLVTDIVHSHDWHTSFLLKLLASSSEVSVKTVLSVHNIGNIGLVTDDGLNNEIDGTTQAHALMAVGVDAASKVVPVSKNYAQELLRGEFCFGLESVVSRNKDKFIGITNGIDTDYFDPAHDPFIGHTYTGDDWEEGKLHAKKELFKKEKWESVDPSETFLFGFVGRIAAQKNIDLIIETIRNLNDHSLHFVFLGVGEAHLTERLHDLALKHNNRVKFINRFDESLARLIYAGSDSFLVPSAYEPCGLTQMISMRYGSVPIGRSVGGLVDTIDDGEDTQNGFLFEHSTVEEFTEVLMDVYDEWRNNRKGWREMVKRGMSRDFSWKKAAEEYVGVYRSLL